MHYPKITRSYISVVIALGAVCVALSILTADYSKIDIHLALLFVFTVAIGSRITIKLNGSVTAELDDTSKPSGILALQLHRGPGMQVEFRNMRIRALK